jgi:hypothetical protein
MRTRFVAIISLVVVGMGVALMAAPAPKDPPPAKGTQWEYKKMAEVKLLEVAGAENRSVEAGLNKLGEDRWELISVVVPGAAGPNGPFIYFFKRPK